MATRNQSSTPVGRKRKRPSSSSESNPGPTPGKRPKRAAAQTAQQKLKEVIAIEKQKEKKTEPATTKTKENGWFKVRAILEESATHYNVDWEDDEETGEAYPVEWIPKSYADKGAVADWEQTKAQRAAVARRASILPQSSPPETSSPAPLRLATTRNTRSPVDSDSVPCSPVQRRPAEPARREPIARPSPVRTSTRSRTPTTRRLPSPRVVPSQRSNLDNFQPISVRSSPHSLPDSSDSLACAPQRAPAPVPFVSSGIVPDSQSQQSSHSYLPSTGVATTSTQQQSLGTLSGTADIDTSLDILGSSQRYPSPVSIPETQDPIESVDSASEPDFSVPETQDDANAREVERAGQVNEPLPTQLSSPEESLIARPQIEASIDEDPESFSLALGQQESADGRAPEDISLQEEVPATFIQEQEDVQDKEFEQPSRAANGVRAASEQPQHPKSTAQLTRAGAVHLRHATVEPTHQTSKVHSPSQAKSPHLTPAGDQIHRRDFAESWSQGDEQDAQIVPIETYASTPESSIGSVRPTTELVQTANPSVDNDYKEPLVHGREESEASTEQEEDLFDPSASSYPHSNDSSSPPPRVPSQSLQTLDSHAPPPLQIPTDSSQPSQAIMPLGAGNKSWDEVAAAAFAQANAQFGLVPLVRGASAAGTSAAGTRSPSTIPDRSPQPTAPTSLREVAMSNLVNADPIIPTAPNLEAPPPEEAAASAPPSPQASPSVPEPTTSASASQSTASDASSDNGASLLNDGFELSTNEHVIPLPMEGRQRQMYLEEIKRKSNELEKFLGNSKDYPDTTEFQALIDTLKAVENHIDLLYAESNTQQDTIGLSTQMSWDTESSVKFRFLGSLFDSLRETQLHVILVIEQHNKKMFDILQRFCRAKGVNYSCPATGLKAKLSEVEGDFIVTILSSDSSPLVRPPSAIICIDGPMEANRIRQNKWSINPDKPSVPIIDLVIPNTISHIEQYINESLDPVSRLHTMFASLAHVRATIGKPLTATPSAFESGSLVAAWLQETAAWGIPSIGSIKDVIDFESQQSQDVISSPVREMATLKRPLEDDEFESKKRARTAERDSSPVADVTHITDSMPRIAISTDIASLQAKLVEMSTTVKASERRAFDFEAALDKRHNEHEELRRQYLTLNRVLKAANEKVELANKQKQYHMERFDKKSAELGELRAHFQQQQDLNLASEDNKIAEIEKLRKELAEAKAAEERAVNRDKSTSNTLDFVRAEYQKAQSVMSELRDTNDTLTAQVAEFKKKAESNAADLKKIFYDKQCHTALKDRAVAKNQVAMLTKQLHRMEDEMAKMKTGRGVGMGTRAQSVPRSPRVGGPASRGASPAPHRDRLTNLRSGQVG